MNYSSIKNPKIKELKKLNQKKYRDLTNTFLIEGEHLIEEAQKTNLVKEIYTLGETGENTVSKEVMKELTSLETYTNIIAVCQKKEEEELSDKILILDNIQDPGNLGTIIRSAVAFNIKTIVLSKGSADVYNSKVLRATQGMIFKINIIYKELESFVKEIKGKYKILTTSVTNGIELKSIYKQKKIAIIMGNEGKGVSKEIESLADDYLYIKMNKECESLNVAIATSIIMYELGSD